MKSLDEIWQEFLDTKTLSRQTLLELTAYIEDKMYSWSAINLATDIIIESIMENINPEQLESVLVPAIARQLDSESATTREFAIGSLIGRLSVAEYGEKALFLAQFDPDETVQSIATSGLGWIMNKVDPELAHKMAMHLYTVVTGSNKEKYDTSYKGAAKKSVLISMGVFYYEWPKWDAAKFDETWKEFLKKYNLKEKEVVHVEKGW